MNYEQALIAQARPQVLSAKARLLIEQEITKGCLPEISRAPLALEPSFQSLADTKGRLDLFPKPQAIMEMPPQPDALTHLRIWVKSDHLLDWKRAELFLKQLQALRHRIMFCLSGNSDEVDMRYVCHKEDASILATAFQGEFEKAEIAPANPLPWRDVTLPIAAFRDYYPLPPYNNLLTRPEEIQFSPYESFLHALTLLDAPAIGVYQVVFQPVAAMHNWHQNVQVLLDIQYFLKQVSGIQPLSRLSQQGPSGDLRHMADEVVTKGHPDKPFFVVAVRTALLGNVTDATNILHALTPFMGLFQHGGRPLNWIEETEYRHILDDHTIYDMFALGTVYRSGFLANSWEVSGLVHVPSGELIERMEMTASLLPPIKFRPQVSSGGILIGTCNQAGQEHPVYIEEAHRKRHAQIIGASGTGKSTLLKHMIFQDVAAGKGVAVLDPHGDLVDHLLELIPPEHAERIIYFDPGDTEWITLWNPLTTSPGQDISQTADNLVTALRNTASGWGDRIEYLLRHAFLALLKRPGSTLMDAARLLRKEDSNNKYLRDEILPLLENDLGKYFWQRDLGRYHNDATSVAQHKLGKLLLAGPIALMLGQPESRFTIHQIMEENLILLANLSTVGSETRQVLGRFLLSLIYLNALARSNLPASQRKAFQVYCDEAHLFLGDTIEDFLVAMRKYNVGLNLAHQYMGQFKSLKSEALTEVGSSIIFRIDSRDAEYFCRSLMGKAQPKDLIQLEDYHAVARTGARVYYIRTHDITNAAGAGCRERIIKESRRKYCVPANTLLQGVVTTMGNWTQDMAPHFANLEEFIYDEFEERSTAS